VQVHVVRAAKGQLGDHGPALAQTCLDFQCHCMAMSRQTPQHRTKTMTRTALFAFAMIALPYGATAQTIDCANPQTQIDMTQCASNDYEAADARLNAAYGPAIAYMASIDADLDPADQGAEAALREGQRAWITFRDATCTAEGYSVHGGTMEGMVILMCNTRLTLARAEDLEALKPWY